MSILMLLSIMNKWRSMSDQRVYVWNDAWMSTLDNLLTWRSAEQLWGTHDGTAEHKFLFFGFQFGIFFSVMKRRIVMEISKYKTRGEIRD